MDINCPLCGSKATFLLEKEGEYEIRHCNFCGGEFAYPMKGGSGEFYEKSYGATGGGYGEDKWEFSRFLNDAKKLGLSGKLLEIGSGPGWFLKMAQNAGFDVYGIDFNRAAVEHSNSIGLKNVKVHDLEQVKNAFPGILFDVIILFHVFEHLENPMESVGQFKEILKSDGVLVVATPNRNRAGLKFLLGRGREGWDYPPHHLTRWDKASLPGFLERSGLEPVILEEERVESFNGVFRFIMGILHLWTATGVLANTQKGAEDEVGNRKMSLLIILARLKGLVLSVIAFVLFVPVFLISKIVYIKGINLYCVAKNKLKNFSRG